MLSDLLKAFGTITGDIKHIEVLCYSLKIIMSAAVGGVLTNIVLLGIDQLVDAPSFKIASFIRWYGWVSLGCGFLLTLRCQLPRPAFVLAMNSLHTGLKFPYCSLLPSAWTSSAPNIC